MKKINHNPLVNKTMRYKNPSMEFFCPLCSTKRSFVGSPRLSRKNWGQLILTAVILAACLFPLMGPSSMMSLFIVWSAFEAGKRINFRKEIPCPHCGFDASWYKRDVKVAKRIVKDFWQEKEALKASKQEGPDKVEVTDSPDFNPLPGLGDRGDDSSIYQ